VWEKVKSPLTLLGFFLLLYGDRANRLDQPLCLSKDKCGSDVWIGSEHMVSPTDLRHNLLARIVRFCSVDLHAFVELSNDTQTIGFELDQFGACGTL
jgi:hypothetical protein